MGWLGKMWPLRGPSDLPVSILPLAGGGYRPRSRPPIGVPGASSLAGVGTAPRPTGASGAPETPVGGRAHEGGSLPVRPLAPEAPARGVRGLSLIHI
eukprot:11370422-Alexandrium_andersonii.AAC.1